MQKIACIFLPAWIAGRRSIWLIIFRFPTEKCDKQNQAAQNKRLDLQNVIGVFIVWAAVVALSFVLIILQFQWRKLKIQLATARGRTSVHATVVVATKKQTEQEKQAWAEQV